jgi:oxalate decarboxylase/phosphoglucose isomerase-like protein (cupin superfamily)
MINYKVLKQEIVRDPQGLGYADMTADAAAAALNLKQFYQTNSKPHTDMDARLAKSDPGAMGATGKYYYDVVITTMGALRISRAEQLFGLGASITDADVELALLS